MSAPEAAPPMGERVRRQEDPRFITGQGTYVGDIRLPGMLHAAFVRCPYGHARMTRLSLDRVRAMPGVQAVFSARDLPVLQRAMTPVFEQPDIELRMPSPLAEEEIRCAGEAVAVVVADDLYHAADAAEAVEVEYDQLPVVVDVEAALATGSVQVHPDVPGNVAGRVKRGYGDTGDAVFERAPVILREQFRAERATGASIEPRGVVAAPGEDETIAITVWDSTQAPHVIRRCIAQTLGLPPEQVRVITPDVGGGFGPKGRYYPEEAVLAVLAMHLRCPVSWQATRHEDMLAMYAGRGAVVNTELAADDDGTLRALRVQFLQDCGAYLPTATVVPQNSAQHILGPYRLPAYEAEVVSVYTNKVPLTPLRGGGRELGVFVMERLMDRLAERLNLEPDEVRRRNALRPEEFPYDTGYPARAGGTITYDSGDYHAALAQAGEMIGYDEIRAAQAQERQEGRYRGVAVTLFLESTGMDRESARVEVGADGGIVLTVGSPSNGQSHATTMAQICASRLGVPLDRITYRSGDTGLMDVGTGTFGSRMAVMAGNATAGASHQLQDKIFDAAERHFEAARSDLELVDGMVQVRGVPSSAIALGDLAVLASGWGDEGSLTITQSFAPERPTAFSGGAHAAVVEVDVQTGLVHVQRYVVVHDCGTVINPNVVEGQVHGGVAHGLGNVLGERMVYDEAGRLYTDSFHTYSMPLAEAVPPFEVEHRESPSPFNPEGIKGAGEGGTIGALATITAAVENALEPLHLKLHSLPLSFEELARACEPLRTLPAGSKE
jgi:aerobic carbon-monoxide dehydrogenase large subunit